MKNIMILGGDIRQSYLANLLHTQGFLIHTYAQPQTIFETKNLDKKNEVYLFPLPISKDDIHLNAPFYDKKILLEDIIVNLPKDALVFAGNVTSGVQQIFDKYGIKVIDYLARESLAMKNAIPTAEGAIAIALEQLPITLWQSKALVIGTGKIAKVLAQKLYVLGANVTVVGRNVTELEYIKTLGIEAKKLGNYGGYDVIFNTVPKVLLDAEKLQSVKKDTIIIDLASNPGGVDFETAKKMGLRVTWALSLPGKVAPISAAQYIFETILTIFREQEGEI